ncbi:hypothetical protein GDO78_011382 [Eleutherodactylus coqui]|uniref:Uncharacterized protein n=1 Tax=Eleutherodactylus coqui TaxID=57060 RepID=A0A8J6F9E6_ELECQ|nr:hypothetical protein GDO78_011382 [Eleutherodactylus coqui]
MDFPPWGESAVESPQTTSAARALRLGGLGPVFASHNEVGPTLKSCKSFRWAGFIRMYYGPMSVQLDCRSSDPNRGHRRVL